MLDKRYPGPETIFRRTLANGITLLAYENFSNPTLAFEGVIRAGSILDKEEKFGLASFTADMLMRGCGNYDFSQVYELLESAGASLSFGVGRHATQFSGSCLIEDVDKLFDLMVQALRKPAFPAVQIERLRGQIQTSLQIRANDTRRMAGLKFMETLYKGHPYGRSTLGYPDTIRQITADDLSDFHALYYGPQRSIIAFSGAFRAEHLFEKVDAVLGDWNNPRQEITPDVEDVQRPIETVVVQQELPGKAQSDLILGLPGPRRSAPDYLAASLMNTVLGEFAMMGRIGQAVRQGGGLAYYTSSYLAGGLGPGPWSAEAGTAVESVAEVIDMIKEEILRMQNDLIPVDELEDCKSYRIGSLPVGLETNAALADTLVDLQLYGLGLDYLQNFENYIQQIQPHDVQSAAQKYLSADQLVISVAGPAASPIDQYLENKKTSSKTPLC